MNNKTKGFASLSVLILLSSFITTIILIGNIIGSRNAYSNQFYHKNISKEMSYVGIKDSVNYFLSGNNKNQFYNREIKSPCVANSSIRNITSGDSNSFNINNLLNNSISNFNLNDTIIENQGFINRQCTIFTKGLPHKLNSIVSYKGDISFENNLYVGKTDENGFYNIGVIYDNENLGYFFTKSMIGQSQLTINLDYNFDKLYGVDYFNIYNNSKYIKDKINLVKKENNLPLTKTNIYNILGNTLNIDSGPLEIGLIEFDGEFSSDGFKILPNSGKVVESDITVNGTFVSRSSKRLICDNNKKNCQLKNINLADNKIYFFYLKSFDKSVSYHIDFLDNIGNSLDIPSDKLFVSLFGYSDGVLYKNEDYYDLSDLGGYFNSFDSSIYNYVFFNFN